MHRWRPAWASPPLVHFRLGCNELAVLDGAGDDRRLAAERIAVIAETLDLSEPFTRIREAIEERRDSCEP